LEEVQKGEGLKPGEVTVEIRSTGICGYAFDLLSRKFPVLILTCCLRNPDPMFISGTPAVSVL
jgi:hypothetical protein